MHDGPAFQELYWAGKMQMQLELTGARQGATISVQICEFMRYHERRVSGIDTWVQLHWARIPKVASFETSGEEFNAF